MCSALGLRAGGFAIDAACASSLYSIKLAADWLLSGKADVMLAGGISCCDSLMIHAGFTALHALSPTGQSRPFHKDADGLVPAEGVALLVLRLLPDAVKAGDRILAVIRGSRFVQRWKKRRPPDARSATSSRNAGRLSAVRPEPF